MELFRICIISLLKIKWIKDYNTVWGFCKILNLLRHIIVLFLFIYFLSPLKFRSNVLLPVYFVWSNSTVFLIVLGEFYLYSSFPIFNNRIMFFKRTHTCKHTCISNWFFVLFVFWGFWLYIQSLVSFSILFVSPFDISSFSLMLFLFEIR